MSEPFEDILEGWPDQDDLTKKKTDGHFVSCSQEHEREYVIHKMMGVTHKSWEEVEEAFELCCKTEPSNKPRQQFLLCMLLQLADPQ